MTTNLLADRRTPWIIGLLAVVLFLTTNLPWQLDDYDQAKQAYTSFEMVQRGHWLYQHTPHEKIATKPPLIGWISAGLFEVTRSWDLAWRLPSFLAAIALAIFIFRSATAVYGAVPGLIALSAFGLNLLTPRLATLVRTDMPLALVIFLIGLQIWTHVREKRGWETRDRATLFCLLTAAMLIKGPIVYAFILPAILVFVWWPGGGTRAVVSQIFGGRQSGRPPVWTGWWPWVASLSIFLIWVAGGIIFQPGFYEQVVMREFVGRFGETIHRPQPFYFYLPHLLHKFAPWSIFVIALAVAELRALVRLDGFKPSSLTSRLRQTISPETFWLICWSLGGLIVMSFIPSKRVDRIFPVIPPLCLLLGAQMAQFLPCSDGPMGRHSEGVDPEETGHRPVATAEGGTHNRGYTWTGITLAAAILFTGVYAISKVVSGYRNNRDALVVFSRDVLAEANKHHWRYEVATAADEGLLLYLQRPHFIKSDRVIADWNAGKLDAVIAPAEDAPGLVREMQNASLSQLKSETRKEERDLGYVLITR